MKLPDFFETSHPLISPLLEQSDTELLEAFQQNPEQGRYFIAIFCRYGPLTYSLLTPKATLSLQIEYLFARVWRNFFFEFRGLSASELSGDRGLQQWIFEKTAVSIHTDETPAIEHIPYSIDATPVPLWCYLLTCLDHLPPLERLVLVLSKTFHWPEAKIQTFMAAEHEDWDPSALTQYLETASDRLSSALPSDVYDIYLAKA